MKQIIFSLRYQVRYNAEDCVRIQVENHVQDRVRNQVLGRAVYRARSHVISFNFNKRLTLK